MTIRAATLPLLSALLSLLASLTTASGQVTYPQKIGEREFIADKAEVITPGDKDKIRAICSRLLDERGIPLVVVTITSMAEYGAANWQIERYAMNLFDEWGIGHTARNSGILLLVSKGDRKVRIELGAGWNHDRDAIATSIISQAIVPHFRTGQYSPGITQGVEALATRIGGLSATPGASSSNTNPAAASPTPGGTPPVSKAPASGGRGIGSFLGPIACIVIPIALIVVVVVVKRLTRSFGGGVPGVGSPGPGIGSTGYGPFGWGGRRRRRVLVRTLPGTDARRAQFRITQERFILLVAGVLGFLRAFSVAVAEGGGFWWRWIIRRRVLRWRGLHRLLVSENDEDPGINISDQPRARSGRAGHRRR